MLAFVAAYGGLIAYRGQSEEANGSVKGLLLWLAEKIDAIRVPIPRHHVRLLGPAADAIRWVAHAIEDALAAVVDWFGGIFATILYGLAHAITATPAAVAHVAEATAERIGRLERQTLPRYVAAALAPTLGLLQALLWFRKHLTTAVLPRVWHGLEGVGGRVGRLERDATRTARRLRRAEAYLTAAGATVLTVMGLNRLRLRWLRCTKVGRVGRTVCGMDSGLLESLLADALLVTSAFSIAEFARELQTITDTAAREIGRYSKVI